jgi:deoxyribodipyrimidine photo-lyase
LSAYIKFGCVSIREIYHDFKKKISTSSSFFNELYWHDFYAQAVYFYPVVLTKKVLDERFGDIKWKGNKLHFKRWCVGLTGFPIVDAGMRQLNATGFMHNRARMIVASFLVKTLLCDWKLGEKYFASKLVDYDPCSNIGGWLWVAGGGFDSQPYFRIFNPWMQAEKFDENCEYIKKWIPELKDVPVKDIHNWNETCDDYLAKGIRYNKPIVDYSKKRIEALDMYKKYM